jgi:hypothetical protein
MNIIMDNSTKLLDIYINEKVSSCLLGEFILLFLFLIFFKLTKLR